MAHPRQQEAARRLCIERNTTHGMAGTRFHKTWKQMKKRAIRPSKCDVPWYGANGVGIAERWLSFERFRDDMHESYLAHAELHGEANTTIDRTSNGRGYFPDNVRWTTPKQQARNQGRIPRYEHDGRCLSLAEWAEVVGIDACTLKMRLRMGWSVERALSTPVNPSNRGKWARGARPPEALAAA